MPAALRAVAVSASTLDRDRPVLMDVGRDVLRDAMRARGKTVTALAAELGIPRKHLSNVLNGRAPLIDPLLRRLGEATGVGAELLLALLDYGPEPPPAPFGALRGMIEMLGDPTEPMDAWEMLEDEVD